MRYINQNYKLYVYIYIYIYIIRTIRPIYYMNIHIPLNCFNQTFDTAMFYSSFGFPLHSKLFWSMNKEFWLDVDVIKFCGTLSYVSSIKPLLWYKLLVTKACVMLMVISILCSNITAMQTISLLRVKKWWFSHVVVVGLV